MCVRHTRPRKRTFGKGQRDNLARIASASHLHGRLDRNVQKEDLKPPNELDDPDEPLDLGLVLLNQFGGKDVGPEHFVFAERDLQLDGRLLVPSLMEHAERVVKDVSTEAASIYVTSASM